MYNNFLTPIVLPLADDEASELLEPLDVFEDAGGETSCLQIFHARRAESLLFAGSEGLPPLNDKVAFWSGRSPAEGVKKIGNSLVRRLGQGWLDLPEINEEFAEAQPDVIVATPRAKRAPFRLELGAFKSTTQTWDRSSLRTPTFRMATGSPRVRDSSLVNSALSPRSMPFPINRVVAF